MFVIRGMKATRYERARILLQQGAIQDFRQLAEDIGKTALSTDMKMNPKTLRRRWNNPGEWSIDELALLSDLLQVDHNVLLQMADKLRKKKGKK